MHDETKESIEGADFEGEVIEVEILDNEAEPSSEAEDGIQEPVDNESGMGDDGAGDDVAALKDEVEHLREMYLRKLAEFDNFRKRTERERSEIVKSAGSEIVLDLIPVLDNFERALEQSGESSPEAILQGVKMISKQLLEILERRGLEQFDPQGEPFRPEFHDAIQRVEDSTLPPGYVAWVLSRGYLFGGRLLRPAMVGVTAGEPTSGRKPDPGGDVGGESEN